MKPDSLEGLPIPGGIKSMLDSLSGGGETGAPQAPVFGDAGAKKPKAKSQVASFLNSDALPASGNTGTAKLTGQ